MTRFGLGALYVAILTLAACSQPMSDPPKPAVGNTAAAKSQPPAPAIGAIPADRGGGGGDGGGY